MKNTLVILASVVAAAAAVPRLRKLDPQPDCFAEFLEAQGSEITYFRPVRNFYAWTDAAFANFGAVDFLGFMNEYVKETCPDKDLGTEVSGWCSKTTMDGVDEYKVGISTTNANMWVMHASDLQDYVNFKKKKGDFTPSCPEDLCGPNRARFGVRADTNSICLDDADVAKGNARYDVTFTIPEGDPIPDLLLGGDRKSTSIHATAVGRQGAGVLTQKENPNEKGKQDLPSWWNVEKWNYPGQG